MKVVCTKCGWDGDVYDLEVRNDQHFCPNCQANAASIKFGFQVQKPSTKKIKQKKTKDKK